MLNVIIGPKGSGKTKKIIEGANSAAAASAGTVVCIEFGKNLTYSLSHKIRLVDAKEYGINNADMLAGVISGLHAGNYDIRHIFVDNLYKTIGKDKELAGKFLIWCAKFAESNDIEITVSVSESDPETIEEFSKSV